MSPRTEIKPAKPRGGVWRKRRFPATPGLRGSTAGPFSASLAESAACRLPRRGGWLPAPKKTLRAPFPRGGGGETLPIHPTPSLPPELGLRDTSSQGPPAPPVTQPLGLHSPEMGWWPKNPNHPPPTPLNKASPLSLLLSGQLQSTQPGWETTKFLSRWIPHAWSMALVHLMSPCEPKRGFARD